MLLILAGVTVAVILNGGILEKAQTSTQTQQREQIREEFILELSDKQAQKIEDKQGMIIVEDIEKIENVEQFAKKETGATFKYKGYTFEIDNNLNIISIEGQFVTQGGSSNNSGETENNNGSGGQESQLIQEFTIKTETVSGVNITINLETEISTTDGSQILGYIIFVNGKGIDITKSMPYTIKGLQPESTNTMKISAIDVYGNIKASSNTLQETIPGLIETVLDYPILTINGMVNVKYTNPADETDFVYGLDLTKDCTATDALDKAAYDGDETTCSTASEGKNKFLIQAGVKPWYIVCKSIVNPAFYVPNGYWVRSDWESIGNDWWYVKTYGKEQTWTEGYAVSSTDIYELKYDLTHAE